MAIAADPVGIPLSVQYDAIYKPISAFSPTDLMRLWEDIARRAVFGKSYRIFKGDPRSSRFWTTFCRARKFFIQQQIHPERYFQAIFDHAIYKRKHLTPGNPLMHSPEHRRKLWRPWPTALTSEFYMNTYKRWEERQRVDGESLQIEHGKTLARARREHSDGGRWKLVRDSMKVSAELYIKFPIRYPMYRDEQVLSIVFTEMCPYFLYFCPGAQKLLNRGYGTVQQRKVFRYLLNHETVAARCQRYYDEIWKEVKEDSRQAVVIPRRRAR